MLKKTDGKRPPRGEGTAGRSALRLAAIVALAGFGLAGCASWFGDSQASRETAGAERVPGEKESYPNLATVPPRPSPETTPTERREIARGLIADRVHAQYTDQQLRASEPAAVAPPPPAPPATMTPSGPAPARMPPDGQSSNSGPSMPLSSAAANPAPSPPPTPLPSSAAALPSVTASPPPPPPPPPPAPSSAYSPSQPIPQIVQRAEAPAPPMFAGSSARQAAAPTGEGDAKPPYPPLGPTASPSILPATPVRNASVSASLSRTPRQAPEVGLPLTEEQATLEQTFARSLAEQASNTVAGAPRESAAMAAAGPASAGASRAVPSLVGGTPLVTVRFGHGITGLNDAAKQRLSDFAPQAKRHPGLVRVVGHSSRRTGNMSGAAHLTSNFNVSVDRANAVARELISLGIDPARLKIEAVGASMPRYDETMPSGEAENRRVEIFLE